MAARWSSENVVVEFRDSQVSRRPNGAFWACALPYSPPPRCRVSLGVAGDDPRSPVAVGVVQKRVALSGQTRECEENLEDCWRWGQPPIGFRSYTRGYGEWGLPWDTEAQGCRASGQGCASQGQGGERGSVCSSRPGPRLVTLVKSQNFSEPQQWDLTLPHKISG